MPEAIVETRLWLERLGWKTVDDGRLTSGGKWLVYTWSCGHVVASLADDRAEAWRGARQMALKVTMNGWATIP
ncbi:MAG: hypothetical protein ABFC88_13200 [Thermoguttaceae bacterium]